MAKKKRMGIKEMNAKEELYGRRMTAGKALRVILIYDAVVLAFMFLLFDSWWAMFIGAILGAWYVYLAILPKQTQSRYEERGLDQRNRFINLVTQMLATKGTLVINTLKAAIDKVDGEFAADIRQLTAILMSSDDKAEKHAAWQKLGDKYADDVYFSLFIEALETAYNETDYNIQTFTVFKDSHNAMRLKQKDFVRAKKTVQQKMMVMLGLAFILIGVLAMSRGWANYVTLYAHNIVGNGFSVVFLAVLGFIMHRFFIKFYDNSVTTL